MGCSSSQISGSVQVEDPHSELRLLGFSSDDLDAVSRLLHQVRGDNAGVCSLQALAAFTKTTLSSFALRLFRVSAATEALDLRRLITGLW